MKIKILFLFSLLHSTYSQGIIRVILSTDTNPNYIQFWPVCAKMWSQIVGAQPTLAFVASEDVKINEAIGDVIRFTPIPGIPTSYQAQCIRLLIPALFPNDICITSDIDMLPLQKEFFLSPIPLLKNHQFIAFNGTKYSDSFFRIRMCFNIALGKTFGEIFSINNKNDIITRLCEWSTLGFGWVTDEIILSCRIREWAVGKNGHLPVKNSKFIFIDKKSIPIGKKINYNKNLLLKNRYTNFHCPGPYNEYKQQIDAIVSTYMINK